MKTYRQPIVGADLSQPTADSSARPGLADSSARPGLADKSAVGCDKSAPTVDLYSLSLTLIGRGQAAPLRRSVKR